MWKFKTTKFKNTAPKIPKKEEWITNLPIGNLMQSAGNHIGASCTFMAFNTGAGCLGVLPVNASGRQNQHVPIIYAHSDFLSDFNFSPVNDSLLATGSFDCTVKIWSLGDSVTENISNAASTLPSFSNRVENLLWNPCVEGILAVSNGPSLDVFDVENNKQVFSLDSHDDQIQGFTWRQNGSMIATTCKDKKVRVFDPRAPQPKIQEGNGHANFKDSRITWLGDTDQVITTGFTQSRVREARLFDIKDLSAPIAIKEIDSGTGLGFEIRTTGYEPVPSHLSCFTKSSCGSVLLFIYAVIEVCQTSIIKRSLSQALVPHYDPDSRMVFFAAKGDTNMRFCEVTDNDPFLTEGASDNLTQMMGSCLIPKRCVDVMKGEVNRVLLLCKDKKIIPCPYIVPRKNYHDFHADIFPDTFSGEAVMTAEQWLNGENNQFTTCSLNPSQTATKIKPSKTFSPKNASPAAPSPVQTVQNGGAGEPQQPLVAPTKQTHIKPQDLEPVQPQIPHNIKERINRVQHLFEDPEPQYPHTVNQAEETIPHNIRDRISKAENRFESSNDSVEDGPQAVEVSPVARSSLSLNLSQGADGDATPTNQPKISTLTIKSPEANRQAFGRARSYSTDEEPSQPTNVPDTTLHITEEPKQHIKVITHEVLQQKPVMREKKKPLFGFRVSKFRHLKGTPYHKSNNIENIRNLSNSMPGECDLFHVNRERCAIPLKGAGGLIGVYELSQPGRLPDTDVPYIQNGSKVYDFTWDPFDTCRLVTCCEDAAIRVWQLPEGGLTEHLTDPVITLRGHNDRIFFTKFHPLAKDVLASASHDMQIIVWNLDLAIPQITCTGHTDTIFSLCWSLDGTKFATACKDGKIRIYEPRKSTEPIQEGPGPEGVRGARVVWALDDQYIVVSGFDRQAQRLLLVYNPDDLSSPVSTIELDTSPSILIPFYDEDSSTIFLTGRGDGSVLAYEISDEDPHLFALSPYRGDGLHQAYSFLPKSEVDVRKIEFAKAYKLTHTSAEPISFTVPRVKAQFFQDDIFPPTKVTWEPVTEAADWFSGTDRQLPRISLKPHDMMSLNTAPVEAPRASKFESYNPDTYKTDSQKKEELVGAMMDKLEDNTDKPLPQDLTEGVDEDEWDD